MRPNVWGVLVANRVASTYQPRSTFCLEALSLRVGAFGANSAKVLVAQLG
jgi:hypothetical protein